MRGDGDGWITCLAGHRHWGLHGAAGLLLRVADGSVLLQHRAERSHHGGTWGVPGGARDSGETPAQAALREAGEETDLDTATVAVDGYVVDDHGGWSYTTVLGSVDQARPVAPSSWESTELRWVSAPDMPALPMHPGFTAWPPLDDVPRRLVLVVDVANVMGSRPDGWWHDRLDAARRLRAELTPLTGRGIELPGATGALAGSWLPDLQLVVEGAAAPLADEDGAGLVRRATGSGDDEIVAVVERFVRESSADLVRCVTADRGLAARVRAVGGDVVGPRWLLDLC